MGQFVTLAEIDQTADEVRTRIACQPKFGMILGPGLGSLADSRFLRAAGVDAVGMSTVPEVATARQGGMRVMGISGISNKANLDGNAITTHEEVLEAGEIMVPKLIKVIQGILQTL